MIESKRKTPIYLNTNQSYLLAFYWWLVFINDLNGTVFLLFLLEMNKGKMSSGMKHIFILKLKKQQINSLNRIK